MSMNNLSILLDNLLLNSSKKIKIKLLNEYFEQANLMIEVGHYL